MLTHGKSKREIRTLMQRIKGQVGWLEIVSYIPSFQALLFTGILPPLLHHPGLTPSQHTTTLYCMFI